MRMMGSFTNLPNHVNLADPNLRHYERFIRQDLVGTRLRFRRQSYRRSLRAIRVLINQRGRAVRRPLNSPFQLYSAPERLSEPPVGTRG